jgi:hypothetical protein
MFVVLISGAIRNLSETWPGNKIMLDNIGEPYDVFVHTWSANFGTPRMVFRDANPKGLVFHFRERKYVDTTLHVTTGYVQSIIPGAIVQIEQFQEKDAILDYRLSGLVDKPYFQNLVNSVAMYQGISRVYDQALNMTPKYQTFIRLRTDFEILEPLTNQDLENDIYFAGSGVDPGFGYVSDQFIISNKEVAKKLGQIEGTLREHVLKNGWGETSSAPFYGERILSYVLKDLRKELKVKISPIKGQIKRPAIEVSHKLPTLRYLRDLTVFNLTMVRNLIYRFLIQRFK